MATEKLRPGMLIRYDYNHMNTLFLVLVRRLVEHEKRFSFPDEECWEYIDSNGRVKFYFFRLNRVQVVETESVEDLDNAEKDEEPKTSC